MSLYDSDRSAAIGKQPNDEFTRGYEAGWNDAMASASAQRAQRANLLIQQLAWYYRVNDCAERHEDDAIEVPILDLRVAYEIARDLGLPDGPALTSTDGGGK